MHGGREITTSAKIDFTKVARETIREAGYTRPEFGFDYQNCAVVNSLDEQSPISPWEWIMAGRAIRV